MTRLTLMRMGSRDDSLMEIAYKDMEVDDTPSCLHNTRYTYMRVTRGLEQLDVSGLTILQQPPSQ